MSKKKLPRFKHTTSHPNTVAFATSTPLCELSSEKRTASSNFKYDYDYAVPMYLPSCFLTPDAQHNKYTLSALILLHIFGKNTRMCSPTGRSIHYLHYFHRQLHRGHVLAQNVRFKRCHFDEAEKTPSGTPRAQSRYQSPRYPTAGLVSSRICGQAARYDSKWRRAVLNFGPTSSPGSSCFSKWRRLGRRPWHTADHVSPTRMEMYSKWRLQRKG